MMILKHSWVCSICGNGFTRNTSARRHNRNLHSGGALIVRPFDYVVGRLKGEYSIPTDPLSYRRRNMTRYGIKNKAEINTFVRPYYHEDPNYDSNLDDKKFRPNESFVVDNMNPDNLIQRPSTATQHNKSAKNDHRFNAYDEIPSSLHLRDRDAAQKRKTTTNNSKPNHDLHRLLERKFKLKELEKLLNKHYPPQVTSQILGRIIFLLQQADDDEFLERQLTWIRNVDGAT